MLAGGNCGLLVSLSGARLGLPGRFQAARGAGLRELGRLAEAVDDQVAGEYLTLYGEAAIVTGERVAELTWLLLLAYMHPAEAAARWERNNADGSHVAIVLRLARVTGRQQVR